jgi:hypothetical protein
MMSNLDLHAGLKEARNDMVSDGNTFMAEMETNIPENQGAVDPPTGDSLG